jgi:hypothetical protein
MEITLPALVALLVGCLALAFYMNWLGLFVSDAEMRGERERAKERMQGGTGPTGGEANQQGHRSGHPNEARREDLWRDDGGQG